LLSHGRPPVAGRDEQRRFWAAIAAGMASEDAAIGVGVPQAIGTRWFRKAGGMPPAMFGRSAKPLSGRYLSFAEREEIGLLRAQGHSIAGDRSPVRAGSLDDLAGTAAQRRHPKWRPRISRDDSPMVRRARGSAPKAGQTCAECGLANLCGGTTGRYRRGSGRGSCSRPGGDLEGPAARPAEGPAMGKHSRTASAVASSTLNMAQAWEANLRRASNSADLTTPNQSSQRAGPGRDVNPVGATCSSGAHHRDGDTGSVLPRWR
jgi:hypothetical protein